MFSLQFSYGVADAELGNTPNRRIYETSETDNLMGITFKIIDENYKINLGYLHAHSDLNRVNKNSGITTANGKTKLDMFALESQFSIDDFTIKAGVIDGKISRVLPDEFRYYTSLEYNIDKFTPYIYYSYEKLTNKSINPTPPAPPIVQVNEGKEKFSLGLRYELSSNSALKFSYSNEDRYRKNKNIISNIESTTRTKSDVFRLVLNVVF